MGAYRAPAMNGDRPHWGLLIGATCIALVALGMPYFRLLYSQVELPDSLVKPALALLLLLAAACVRYASVPVWAAWLALGSTGPIVVLARVVRDTAQDPTSHNLWPFELVIAGAVTGIAALAGAFLGVAALRMRGIIEANRD